MIQTNHTLNPREREREKLSMMTHHCYLNCQVVQLITVTVADISSWKYRYDSICGNSILVRKWSGKLTGIMRNLTLSDKDNDHLKLTDRSEYRNQPWSVVVCGKRSPFLFPAIRIEIAMRKRICICVCVCVKPAAICKIKIKGHQHKAGR